MVLTEEIRGPMKLYFYDPRSTCLQTLALQHVNLFLLDSLFFWSWRDIPINAHVYHWLRRCPNSCCHYYSFLELKVMKWAAPCKHRIDKLSKLYNVRKSYWSLTYNTLKLGKWVEKHATSTYHKTTASMESLLACLL